MRTQVLRADSPAALEEALTVLRAGGLVAFPTDTVYGLGALAFLPEAVMGIYGAKDRPFEKSIPILLAAATDLNLVAAEVTEMGRRLAERFWPGPLTVVVHKNRRIPEAVSTTDTVGTRVPDHPIARALLRIAGPLAVTSANLSGRPSPESAQDVLGQLNGRIVLVLDGGKTPGGVPSTVVDCTEARPVILRDGPISLREISRALETAAPTAGET